MKELKGNRGRKKNTAEHRETEIGESFWLSPVRYRSSSIPQKSIPATQCKTHLVSVAIKKH